MKRVLVIMAALGVAFWMSRQMEKWLRPAPGPPPAAMVVTALTEIPAGERIDENNARLTPWPGTTLPPGMFADLLQVKGRVVAIAIHKGDPVHEYRLAPPGPVGAGGTARRIAPGMRAAAVPLEPQDAGLSAGDRVDLFLTSRLGSTAPRRHIARMAAENVLILAVDASRSGPGVLRSGGGDRIAVLLLTEAQNRALAVADRETLRFVLRHRADTSVSARREASYPPVPKAETGAFSAIADAALPGERTPEIRALTLPYTRRDGFCGWLVPGSRVDVAIVSGKGDIAAESLVPGARASYLDTRKFARILSQNLPVIEVTRPAEAPASDISRENLLDRITDRLIDQTLERTIERILSGRDRKEKGNGPGGRGTGRKDSPRGEADIAGYLTLLVPGDRAERIIIAAETNRLRFIYRNQSDDAVDETAGRELKHCFFKPFEERAYLVELHRGGREILIPMPLPEESPLIRRAPESGDRRRQPPPPLF